MNPFDLFNNNSDDQRRKNDLKNASLQITTLLGTGYAASKLVNKTNLKNSFETIVNQPAINDRELGKAGRNIKESVDNLTKALIEKSSKDFQDKILNDSKIDEILSGTDNVADKRALLASLFDSYRMEIGENSWDEGISLRIKEAYEQDKNLTNSDIESIKTFYKENISKSPEALERFKGRYSRSLRVKELLASGPLQSVAEDPFKSISGVGNFFEQGSKDKRFTKVNEKYNSIKGMFGNRVSLVERDDAGIKSLYARINFGSEGTVLQPLSLGKNSLGMPVYSATQSGATLYAAPLKVLNAPAMHKAGYRLGGGSNVPGLRDFEDVIFDALVKGHSKVGSNFRKQEINAFYSYMRDFGTDLPRTLFDSSLDPEGSKHLLTSKGFQGTSIYIEGLNELPGDAAKNFDNRLIRSMPSIFGGPGSQQTVTSRFDDPFERGKKIAFKQIALLQRSDEEGKLTKTLNPISALRAFGRESVDRAVQPQTARETQLFGRPEYLFGEASSDRDLMFGKSKNIRMFGENKQLLGVNEIEGATLKGANLGMFMVVGDKASELGLSEGSAYGGGRFSSRVEITKTITQEGIEKFELVKLLERLKTEGKALKVGKALKTNEAEGVFGLNDFFKRFGVGGEAIFSYSDSGMSSIKRHKGLESFELEIKGATASGGRTKVHLGGYGVKQLEFMKLFSAGFKGTLETAQEAEVKQRLGAMGYEDQFSTFLKSAPFKASVITDESMIKKSAHFLGMQMFGGYKLFGGDEDKFYSSMTKKIGKDADYLKMIEGVKSGKGVADLTSASVKSRQAGFLRAMIETVLENTGGIEDKEIGMILGGVQKLGTRFGLEQKEIDELILKKGSKSILAEAKKGIAAGAMYATGGDVYTDLSRNLAKIEPRFANYLYQSLRSNFGMSGDEASEYISSIVSRQQGVASRGEAALGMKIAQFSLSSLSEGDVAKQISGLSNVRNLSAEESAELLGRAGDESALSSFLSGSKSGNIIETNKLGLSKTAREKLEASLGGKKSFFLGGEDTYSGLQGHIIRSQGKDVNIANEYVRYTNDLVGALYSLREAGEDETKINRAMRGFETSKGLLGKTAGTTLRNILSGKVLGSGTYRGRGISLGKDPTGGLKGNLGGKIVKQETLKGFQKVFDKTGGYAIFADTQAFMDGMSTFKEAARREVMRKTGKADVKAEVDDLMNKTLKDFFLGMYSKDPKGVMVDAQRNPLIGMGNIFANIEMFRSDAFEDEDEFFKRFIKDKTSIRYEKSEATADARRSYFEEEKLKRSADIRKANIEREKTALTKLAGTDQKFKAALDFQEPYLKAKSTIDEVAGRSFKGKNATKDFFKYLNIYMGAESTGGSGRSVFGYEPGQAEQFYSKQRKQHLESQIKKLKEEDPKRNKQIIAKLEKDMGEDAAAVRSRVKGYQDKTTGIGSALNFYRTKQDQIKQYKETMTEARSTAEYRAEKGTVSEIYEDINKAVKTRMVRDEVYKNYGEVKGNKLFENLREMENLYIKSGKASKEFMSRSEGLRFSSFKEIAAAGLAVKGTKGEAEFERQQGKVLRNMLRSFIETGDQGGGTISFFDVKIESADLIGKDGNIITKGGFSGRGDINRGGIGDFDGDIYQVFFSTRDQLKKNVPAAAANKMHTQALTTSLMLDQLTKGMGELGKRLGAGDMNLIASQISEKEKERIFKGVGGVDIEIKTLMMGMAQNASNAADPDAYLRNMNAGMALLASMQEQLVIQAKKLPIASNVPEELTKLIRRSRETGSAKDLNAFLERTIFRGTELASEREIRLSNIQFANIDAATAGGKKISEEFKDVRINLDEIFQTIDQAAKTVKETGIDKMPSDSRLTKALMSGRVADLKMLSNLLSAGMTMEGGFIGGNQEDAISEINRIMNNVESITSKAGSSFAQRAGALGIAGGLIASGAIGSMMSTGEINPSGNFSDMRVRENMSMRNLQQNMGREHGNVSPSSVGGPRDNFYERPINSGETSVVSNVSTRFYGEAGSMSSAVSMGRQFASVGGQASMLVNDTRMPISNSYISKSLRD